MLNGNERRSSRPAPRRRRLVATAVALTTIVAMVGAGAWSPASAAVVESTSGPLGFFSLATPAPAQTVSLQGGAPTTLTVAGVGGVPASGVASVVATVTVAQPAGSSALRVWASGRPQPVGYAMQFTAGQVQSTTVTAAVGTEGRVALQTPAAGVTSVSVAVVGFSAVQQWCTGSCWYHNRFVPARGTTVYDGFARPGTPGEALRPSSGVRTIPVAGLAGVPVEATRVVLRVSVLPSATPVQGRVDVRAAGQGVTYFPGVISVGGPATKIVTADLGSGAVEVLVPYLTSPGGAVDVRVAVDVIGSYVGPQYAPAAVAAHPASVLPSFPARSGTPVALDTRALDGLPLAYSSVRGAVLLDVSVSGATRAGTVAVGPVAVPQLAFAAGQSVTNQVVVPVTSATFTPTVTYTASGGTGSDTVTVRVTPVGTYQVGDHVNPAARAGDLFTPVDPVQLHSSPFVFDNPGSTITLPVLGRAGVPATGVSRVLLQVQVRNATAPTSVTVGQGQHPLPGAAQVTTSGPRTANQVPVAVGPDGRVRFQVGAARATVDVSVVGWFTPFSGNGPQAASVAIWGDSITTQSTQTMAALEATREVTAFGLAGFQADAVAWWAPTIADARPDQVIVNLGTNDAWIGVSGGPPTPAQTRTSIEAQLAAHPQARCRFVVTVNARTAPSAAYQERANAINAEYRAMPGAGNRIGLVDWDAYLGAHVAGGGAVSDLISADGIHPTTAGFTALAGLYRDAIEATGARPELVTPCS